MSRRLLVLVLAAALPLGCGDSTGPEDQAGPESLPEIPRPLSLTDLGANKSEVYTEVRRLQGDFVPALDEVTADWAITAVRSTGSYQGLTTTPIGACPAPVFEGHAPSSQLANAVEHTCYVQFALGGFVYGNGAAKVPAGSPLVPDSLPRHPMWREGTSAAEAVTSFSQTLTRDAICSVQSSVGPCTQSDVITYQLRWPVLTNDVYVRRDRWWERRPLLGDDSEIFILEGPVTRSVSFSYSSGSTTEDTEEFGRSLTVEVGGSWSFFSASVSATLSQTFTTRVEVRADTTVSVTEELTGEPGVARVMTFWVLVDEYTITDAEGNPYSDPNYVVAPLRFRDQGRITALLATDFTF
jgi:hypothetical protein